MSSKINYSNGEIGSVEITEDFLPKPRDLVMKLPPAETITSLQKA